MLYEVYGKCGRATIYTFNHFNISIFQLFNISIVQYFNCSIFQSFISMKRRDLAKLYFPDMSDVEAVRSLRRWIEGCPQLMSALDELSMPYKKCRILSARQVRIIMEYLGDP